MFKINIITIFPNFFDSVFGQTIIKRAQQKELVKINVFNLRDWTEDRHQTVDDTPTGGGAGLVMKVNPFYKALKSLGLSKGQKNKLILVTSPRGHLFNQNLAKEYSTLEELTLICGRYEGIDQRVIDYLVDGELSVGNYVLSGGEIAVITVVDAVTRLIPGVLGNEESINDESFSNPNILEYPQYTKPASFVTDEGEKWNVPEVLLSGNHQDVEKWRREQSVRLTKKRNENR